MLWNLKSINTTKRHFIIFIIATSIGYNNIGRGAARHGASLFGTVEFDFFQLHHTFFKEIQYKSKLFNIYGPICFEFVINMHKNSILDEIVGKKIKTP